VDGLVTALTWCVVAYAIAAVFYALASRSVRADEMRERRAMGQ
jgi:ABC-type Co2+ transport system permease subunit